MKANELRIGNWVTLVLGDTKTNVRMCQIGKDTGSYILPNCDVAESKWQHSMNCFKPIPLTEEWLLKFGFEFQKCGMDVNSGMFCHFDYWRKGKFLIRGKKTVFGYQDYRKPFVIKHVHQLQNLYWSLTGEELTIK